MTRPGDLERTVMETLWARGPLTAGELADVHADRDLAYTTWLTVLGRLERKGLLTRTKRGRAHAYAPAGSREDHIAVLMRQALGQAGDRTAALQHFARSMTPAEAEAVRAALADLPAGPAT